MRAVKSVSIDSERRVIITYLDGSTETLYPNCIWCDSEALRQLIKDLLEEKADAITQTIENVTIATFGDGADEGLIKKLLVNIEPIQEGEGDPSPENVRPISGRTGVSVVRCGKNLINILDGSITVNGVTATIHDGIVTLEGTSTARAVIYLARNIALPEGTYKLNGSPIMLPASTYLNFNSGVGVVATESSNALDAEFTLTSPTKGDQTSYVRLDIPVNLRTDGLIFRPMIRKSTENQTFEPYKGSTYSVKWETEAGIVYGGTLDVVSGKLTVDRVKETKTWVALGSAQPLTNVTRKRWDFERVAKYISTDASNDLLCNCIGVYSTSYSLDDIHMYIASNSYAYIFLPTSTPDSTVIELSYTIADPIEYQCTPQEVRTLLGVNNIWPDSGNILELEYTADTKLYIGESQVGRTSTAQQSVNRPVEFDPSIVKPVTEVTEKEQIEEEE